MTMHSHDEGVWAGYGCPACAEDRAYAVRRYTRRLVLAKLLGLPRPKLSGYERV